VHDPLTPENLQPLGSQLALFLNSLVLLLVLSIIGNLNFFSTITSIVGGKQCRYISFDTET